MGFNAGLVGSGTLGAGAALCTVAIFDIVFIRLVTIKSTFEVDDIPENLLFIYVIHSFTIAIIIEVDLDEGPRVFAKTLQHAQNDGLLLQRGCFHLQDRDEDLMEEHFDLFLKGARR